MREDIAEQLKAYLDAAVESPMIWGVSDCSMWAARWVEQVCACHLDLPSWSSREEAHALIKEAGSLDALWREVLLSCPAAYETGTPQYGDIGIINTGRFGQVGGIFLDHELFAWRAEPSGVLFLRSRDIVRVWSLR